MAPVGPPRPREKKAASRPRTPDSNHSLSPTVPRGLLYNLVKHRRVFGRTRTSAVKARASVRGSFRLNLCNPVANGPRSGSAAILRGVHGRAERPCLHCLRPPLHVRRVRRVHPGWQRPKGRASQHRPPRAWVAPPVGIDRMRARGVRRPGDRPTARPVAKRASASSGGGGERETGQ